MKDSYLSKLTKQALSQVDPNCPTELASIQLDFNFTDSRYFANETAHCKQPAYKPICENCPLYEGLEIRVVNLN